MPFYSGREKGIGLGMTLTESLMMRMNGTIALANTPEGGAQIVLQLEPGNGAAHG
ncbi:sensory histidine kinase AtoS [compost metagenome]